ncbi:MAG: tetratricopeptide repeat protein, partial [Planctomycetota bacterium]
PVLAGIGGYLWANAPRIAAAAQLEAEQRREETLSGALSLLFEGDTREGLRLLATLAEPPDLEVAVLRAQLHQRAADVVGARAALAGFEGPVVALVLAAIERPQFDPGLVAGEPADAFEAAVRAQILLEGAARRGARTRPLLARALELARAATLLAKRPRLNHLLTLANAARFLDDRDEILVSVRALAAHFPDSIAGLHARARGLSTFDPDAALALVDEEERRPGGPTRDSLVQRAVALEQKGLLVEAIDAGRRALMVAPRDPTALTNLGIVLRKQRQSAESVQVLRLAAEVAPMRANVWNALGLSLRDAGQTDEAVAAFEEALAQRVDYGAAALNLGNLLVRLTRLDDAEAAFRRAIEAEPDNVRALANLGDVLSRLGRDQQAFEYSWRAAQLAPMDLVPNYNVARLALKLGLPELALRAAARAKAVDHRTGNGLQIHADALLAQAEPDVAAALIDARAADARAQGADVEVRLTLVRAIAASGDKAAAIELVRQSLADPRHAGAAAQEKLRKRLSELDDGR